MFDTIDRYKLNLYCRCLECKNLQYGEKFKSCKAYPEENGIPPKVWNGKYAECEHFVREEED